MTHLPTRETLGRLAESYEFAASPGEKRKLFDQAIQAGLEALRQLETYKIAVDRLMKQPKAEASSPSQSAVDAAHLWEILQGKGKK